MRLFISYSHDDKAWVFELWRALRDRAHHDAWIDQRIVPAQDWWDTILNNIERAEVVIYVMSPKSVESIYCLAEIGYALALNKPIIPLMLKVCDSPGDLKRRRIQYQMLQDHMSIGDVLFTVTNALLPINELRMNGDYTVPDPRPARPNEPKPTPDPVQVAEVFMLAEEAAGENNLSLAEKLFQQVIDADSGVYGQAARERLDEIRYERERDAAYAQIVQMAATPALRKGAQALWRGYVAQYGAEYDPEGLAGRLAEEPAVARPVARIVTPEPIRSRVYDLLPEPFEWCEIPAGRVTIEDHGEFEVAAFEMAKYPITNAQYGQFVEAGGYENQDWWTEAGWTARERGWAHVNGEWQSTGSPWTEPSFWRDKEWNGDNQPVVGVSWYETVAFCSWLSELCSETIMLPTEQQWQRAAQGDDGRIYPWGNKSPDDTMCNFANNVGKTTPVTLYPAGVSPFGVIDMSGNVWEWCLNEFDNPASTDLAGDARRVLRGGSWHVDQYGARCAYRYRYFPQGRRSDVGFRVVCVPHL